MPPPTLRIRPRHSAGPWTGFVRAVIAGALLGGAILLPSRTLAQTTYTLEGRVIEASGDGIQNATVALDGIGFRLTDEEGAFRFAGVPPRSYTVRVEALGYEPVTQTVDLEDDRTLTIEMEVSPFELDSIVVESHVIEIEGRVWDPVQDEPVASAEIVSNQADPTRTSWGGRFELRVAEGVPLALRVRAFRFLPLDTLFVPEEDGRYRLELAIDPVVARMLEQEIVRLDDRAGGRRAVGMGPFNRDELRRWRGATLADLMKFSFPIRSRRLQCIVFNERDVGMEMVGPTLSTTFLDDIERVEFLFRGAMMRVYTKEFMRTMVGGGLELRRPVYVDISRRPFCA